MRRYQLTDHTADIGVRAFGGTLEELFVNAAEGMMEIAVGGKPVDEARGERSAVGREQKHEIALKALDKEQLLVKWLSEILYLFNVKKEVALGFRVSIVSDKELSGEVKLIPFDPKKFTAGHDIKAVTYHDLKIKESGGQFVVSVIFDI